MVELTNPQGLHMRPAADLVKAAGKYGCDVTIWIGEKKANAKSVMDLLMLAGDALCGTTLKIEAEGEEAEACLDAMAEIAQTNYDEA